MGSRLKLKMHGLAAAAIVLAAFFGWLAVDVSLVENASTECNSLVEVLHASKSTLGRFPAREELSGQSRTVAVRCNYHLDGNSYSFLLSGNHPLIMLQAYVYDPVVGWHWD